MTQMYGHSFMSLLKLMLLKNIHPVNSLILPYLPLPLSEVVSDYTGI